MSEALLKDEFENTTDGFVGVVSRNPDNKMTGAVVRPKENVLLDKQEQIATANAPKRDKDNPLANGMLKKVRSGSEVENRRPLEPSATPEPEPAPQEAAPESDEARKEREAQERIAAAEAREKAEEAAKAKAEADQAAAAKARVKRDEKADVRPAPKAETGAAKPPAAQAPQGQAAKGEEVATPAAPQQVKAE